ncbi:MAG: glycosyltransferase [Thermodesulfobacteriota bacterium]
MAGRQPLGRRGVRLLLLSRSLELGGAERQLCLLAAGLKARGHQVDVACFYAQGPLMAELASAGVRVHPLGKSGRWDVLGAILALRRLAARLRPQALYSFLDTPNLLAALTRPLRPGLKVAWGVRASDMDLTRYGRFAALTARLLPHLAWGADVIIVNSQAGAEVAAARGLPAGKLVVIPNGIDTERFAPDPAAGAPVRAAWGVDPDETLVGLVGRIDPMKDHANFLRAMARVRERLPGLRLVCVGGGEAGLAELKALAASLGLADRLTWAGPRQDMPAVMNALDLCVLASAYGEGFPNVLGEAMACARPVATTRVGDAAWVVGRPELTAPPKDPAALAAACLGLLARPAAERQALGLALRRRVIEEFSLAAMVQASERVLCALIRA